MSVQVLAAVLEHSESRGVARCVLVAIANHDGDNGAYPSVDTISKEARCSVRSVQSRVRELEASGELHVEERGGPRGTNRYWVCRRVLQMGDCKVCGVQDRAQELHPNRLNPGEPTGPTALSVPAPTAALDATGIVVRPDGPTVGVTRRRRDVLFDALASIDGADPRELTEDAARACGVALSKIRRVAPDLTPTEISRRATNYRSRFDNAALTPSALAKHWADCGRPSNGRVRDNAAAIVRGAFG